MKNIYLLSTDKPSRLWKNNLLQGKLELSKEILIGSNTAQNVYITSDEEIKEGDWFIDDKYKQPFKYFGEGSLLISSKKIILTTDQDLIKDGVQAIDDEFLEWFVKNPNCEQISVEEVYFHGSGYYKASELSEQEREKYSFMKKYKIIIPKEEPKQETVEEAAEKWVFETNSHKWSNNDNSAGDNYGSFLNGAKWQAERMYSEEEAGELVYNVIGEYAKHYGIMIDGLKLNELFEQFKKK